MRTNNKQWRGQAIIFGCLRISKHFSTFNEAVAWYEKFQEGWRYHNAVAVLWQGCTRRTPKLFLHDAMLGGAEWQLWKHRGIASQAHCDYLLNSLDYEIL